MQALLSRQNVLIRMAPGLVVLLAIAAAFFTDRYVTSISQKPAGVEEADTLLRHAILSDGRRIALHDRDDGVLSEGETLRLSDADYPGADRIDPLWPDPVAAHLHVLDGDIVVVAMGSRSGFWRSRAFLPQAALSGPGGGLLDIEQFIDA